MKKTNGRKITKRRKGRQSDVTAESLFFALSCIPAPPSGVLHAMIQRGQCNVYKGPVTQL